MKVIKEEGPLHLILSVEEAAKLGGLLSCVPTADLFFDDLATELDALFTEFLPLYATDESGNYVQQEEV